MKKGLGIFFGLVLLGLLALLLWPAPFDAEGWQPGKAPVMSGVLAPNDLLAQAQLLAQGQIQGPEALAVDQQGRIVAGLHDGRVVRITGSTVTTLVNTQGRPLGLMYDAQGNLIICDAWKGLLQLSPDNQLTVLATEADGLAFGFTDDLDIARDGKIYFTDASSKWRQPDYMLDYLEGRAYGRLLVYDPASQKASTLVNNLYFANGVALSQQEDFVAVAETYRYRLGRYWLKGPKAGLYEVFAENLPGMPDNIRSDRAGSIWVALPTPRKPIADFADSQPWAKELLSKLPRVFWPKPTRYGLAIAVNEQGQIMRSVHDVSGDHLRMVTTALSHQGKLYIGSLYNDRVGVLDLVE